MLTKAPRWAAVVFACVVLVAGGLQLWAYAATDGPRHLIFGSLAIAIGISVVVAVIRGRGRDPRT